MMMNDFLLFYFLCFAFGLSLLCNRAETFQFAKSHDTAILTMDFPPKLPFYEAHVLMSEPEMETSDTMISPSAPVLNFYLETDQVTSGQLYPAIAVKTTTSGYGVRLYLMDSLQSSDADHRLTIGLCANRVGSLSTACLNLTLMVLPVGAYPCLAAPALCYGMSASSPTPSLPISPPPSSLDLLSQSLALPEKNSPAQEVITLHQPVYNVTCPSLEPPSYNYTSFLEGAEHFISIKNGVVILNKRLNVDDIYNFTFEIGCNVTTADGIRHNLKRRGFIRVTTDNDHGPEPLEPSKIIINNTKDFTYKILSVRDHDVRWSPYKVELYDDPLELFTLAVNKKRFLSRISAWLITATVRTRFQGPIDFPGNSYTVTVRFIDSTLRAINISNHVIYTMTFVKPGYAQPTNPAILNAINGDEFNATVFRNAAVNSRVLQPIDSNSTFHAGVIFSLEQTSTSGDWSPLPFNVTSSQGIIYVNDSQLLASGEDESIIKLKLVWRARKIDIGQSTNGHLMIFIQLISTDVIQNIGNLSCDNVSGLDYSQMCSMSGSETTCVQNCGSGSSTGQCQWRNATQYRYATCTPDLRTCPDKICDELERTFYQICPQDCVDSDEVHGVHFSSGKSHGINNGHGTCTCDQFQKCSCDLSKLEDLHSDDDPSHKSSSSSPTHWDLNNKGHVTGSFGESTQRENERDRARSVFVKEDACGTNCIVIITMTGMLFAGVVILCCIFFLRRRKCASQRIHKYPNRDNSIPAVPSDYVVDERSSSSIANSQNNIILQDILSIANKNIQAIESKWEFSRNKLILEQTLGEGEFGRVMRAKALDINGQPGYTTVAVKMSKCVGSNAELDLLQEFNLLREVVHPNVIRVLGACSSCSEGPLFIIVEYAEFGSLRVYLRKSRRLEFKSCTSDDSGVDSLANGGGDHPLSDYQVNPRDLLQFAWQIAKGMAYLGEMKLVHRDLASRNILVAAGKVVKISDFGLTRDVYEGDAYFKKSTGRVPVKWMAIESLSDHVYTTKSDVWSFGIVLWEIITLGAAPYPGIPPEVLYRLLKSGYRMEKPENCSEELYNIMKRCWHEFSHERPSFVELTKKFEDMLQANVVYLDLGVNMVHNMTYFEDTTGQTDTIESEMGYGSWNALPTDDSDYLQSNSNCRSSNVEDEEVTFLLTGNNSNNSKSGTVSVNQQQQREDDDEEKEDNTFCPNPNCGV